MLLLIICSIAGVIRSVSNSRKLDALPNDFSMEQKYEMISRYDNNVKKTDSLEKVIGNQQSSIDSLKLSLRVKNYIIQYQAKKTIGIEPK